MDNGGGSEYCDRFVGIPRARSGRDSTNARIMCEEENIIRTLARLVEKVWVGRREDSRAAI